MDESAQSEHLNCILSNPVFAGLPAPAAADVLAASRLRSIAAGGVLVAQGAAADRFGILLRGRARMTQLTSDGRQIALRYLVASQEFGLIAALPDMVYPVTIEAVDDCQVLCWAGGRLAELFLRHPQIGLNALRIMVIRNQELQARYRQQLTERVEQRLARALLRLVTIAGEDIPQGRLINLPLAREDLAELIGATLFTVSRTLSQWEQSGIVCSGRERIAICRLDALEEIAGEPEPLPSECVAPCALAELLTAKRAALAA
jgi:CRP-like cAMP-binding protein